MPIRLVAATWEQLSEFRAMEQEGKTAVFIAPYSLAQHQTTFEQPAVNYLAIVEQNTPVGFILTALDGNGESVELRRIVVSPKGRGIGQQALVLLERYCQMVWQRRRIWLDVFADNERGLHIYEKLGYTFFKEGLYAGRPLLFYEKWL